MRCSISAAISRFDCIIDVHLPFKKVFLIKTPLYIKQSRKRFYLMIFKNIFILKNSFQILFHLSNPEVVYPTSYDPV